VPAHLLPPKKEPKAAPASPTRTSTSPLPKAEEIIAAKEARRKVERQARELRAPALRHAEEADRVAARKRRERPARRRERPTPEPNSEPPTSDIWSRDFGTSSATEPQRSASERRQERQQEAQRTYHELHGSEPLVSPRQLNFQIAQADLDAIDAAARRAGLSRAVWLRKALAAAVRNQLAD